MNDLPEQFARTVRARKLFDRGERILVAVSGGMDSMALLHLLRTYAPVNDWKLTVAHFNHQLRGRASDADERFVMRTSENLGLKAIIERGDVKSFAKRNSVSIEMAARQLRHSFLARAARRLKVRTIALAHHADDQVELFFLRLLRGSGGEGLAGMKWRSPSPADARIQLVRPLLGVGRDDIEAYARRSKVQFRQDASNASMDVLRNRIRHELLPLLKSRYQPALARTALRVMEIAGAESALASGTADRWLKRKETPFARMPVAVQRHILRLQLSRLGITADFELIEQLRESPEKRVTTNAGIFISRNPEGLVRTRSAGSVAFDKSQLAIPLQHAVGIVRFANVQCRWCIVPQKRASVPKPVAGRECFDADKIGTRIVLRYWRRGDRYRPIGMTSSVKLQDWFTNRKVPREQRHKLLVAAAASGKIFWVEGQRISENFKLTPRTKKRLVWSWRRC